MFVRGSPLNQVFEKGDNRGQDQQGRKVVIMDWSDCNLVEKVPGKMGGRPVVKGTRIEPDIILIEEEHGRTPEETHESFPTLSVETILQVRAFAHKSQLVP
jgi:uncharacterized protein (DUF433 family)